MGSMDKRVDAYIAKSAPFAKPILVHIREVVHKECPDVEETIKWGFPHFDYKGIMCAMAAFKSHCALGFWKSKLIPDPDGLLQRGEEATAMGNLGRITRREDLPSDRVLLRYIRAAAELNDRGVVVKRAPAKKAAVPVRPPAAFQAALKKNPRALSQYKAFTPGRRREYVEWIAEAKGEETKMRRIGTAVEWIAEGKSRNWKYESKKR